MQTAFLGDVVLSTPFVRALKEVFPEAAIDVLTIPETAIVYRHNPRIRNQLTFDKRKPGKRIPAFFSVVRQIRAQNYDLAVSIQTSFTSSLLMLLGGVPQRLGFPRQKLLTMTIDLEKGLPVVRRTLQLIRPFARDGFSIQTELFWDKEEEERVEALIGDRFRESLPGIAIAAGAVWATKRWPKEYYIELLKRLGAQAFNIGLVGGAEDSELCREIIDSAAVPALNLAGELSVLGSAAFIRRMDLIVCNDSAPLHLANAVQTDVIAIFGPTVKRFGFFPFRIDEKVLEVDLYCRPCSKHGGHHCPEKHFRCMREITPERVYREIISHLEENRN